MTQETSLKGFLSKTSKILPKFSFLPYLIEVGIVFIIKEGWTMAQKKK